MQAWLIQRIIREILPFVVEGVRAQMRGREARGHEARSREARAHDAAYGEPQTVDAAPGSDHPGVRALRREMEDLLAGMAEENETRFAALQSQLRALEDRLIEAHAEQQRALERSLLYARMLLGWSAAITLAVLYLLLR
jgi:hypothetical protein